LKEAWPCQSIIQAEKNGNADEWLEAHSASLADWDVPLGFIIDFQGAALDWADMRRADLSWAHLRGARMSECQMQHAYLIAADLSRVSARCSNLDNAFLWAAKISPKASFDSASLQAAYLQEAQMKASEFGNTNFERSW